MGACTRLQNLRSPCLITEKRPESRLCTRKESSSSFTLLVGQKRYNGRQLHIFGLIYQLSVSPAQTLCCTGMNDYATVNHAPLSESSWKVLQTFNCSKARLSEICPLLYFQKEVRHVKEKVSTLETSASLAI